MLKFLRDLRKYRDLLFMLTWRDIRIKYKQSIMGFMWALLMPMLIVAAGLIVKLGLAGVSGRGVQMSQLATVTLKALPWAFFVGAIRFATNSLTSNVNLVTKVAFPRAVFPLAATLSALFDFAIASVVVIVVLTIARVGFSVHLLWVPLLLALLFVQTAGFALLLSAANLFFRDVKYIVEVIMTFAIFFTPVFYEVELFGKWGQLLMLNPVAPILEGLNAAVVHHHAPDLKWTLYAAAWGLGLMTIGPMIFHRLEPQFAESI
ncbi:MAG TPA: ABC transporter permease [Polyangia bacterium]|jgi:ABC-type polysaccharide/polyol phosphate export permease|nr:ABC transporter permease [Polyangia bacterium]